MVHSCSRDWQSEYPVEKEAIVKKSFRASFVLTLPVFVALIGLSFATPASAVPIISITDLTEGNPVVFTSGIDLTLLVIGPETVVLEGLLHIPIGDGVIGDAPPFPPINFVLLEPAFEGGGISDIATITTPAGPGPGGGPLDYLQLIHYTITSEDGLTTPPGSVFSLLEDGTIQTYHLQSQTGANILDLSIQSDAVPEPATLLLLGTGLLAAAAARRFTKRT
jgi:hypothetical protein